MSRLGRAVLAFITLCLPAASAQGQAFPPDAAFVPGTQGSRNIKIMSHLPPGRMFTVTDVEVEQELSRPFAFVSRMHGNNRCAGFYIISLKNTEKAQDIY